MNKKLGSTVIDKIYENSPKSFDSEDTAERIFSMAQNMQRIYDAGSQDRALWELHLQSLLYALLLEIYSESSSEGVSSHHTVLSHPIIEAIYYIEKNYMKQIRIEDAAAAGGYSVSYFSRLFKSQLGQSFSDYLLSIRLKHVKSDLISTDRSITEIAVDNGFGYAGNMTSCFRKKTGMTPTRFRRQLSQGPG